jgi:hypothetical protein
MRLMLQQKDSEKETYQSLVLISNEKTKLSLIDTIQSAIRES